MTRRRDERGVAALEFALFLTALFALAAIVAPLGSLLLTKIRLERVAGEAGRFATQVPDRARPGTTSRTPSAAEVCADAAQRFASDTPGPGWTCSVAANDPSPYLVTVHLTTTVSLGPFGGLLAGAGLADGDIDLAATAVGRQE